jgi:hypothetical protein
MNMPIGQSNATSSYITVTSGMSGWFAVHMGWNSEHGGFWEPWVTGSGRYPDRAGAEEEAKDWAAFEGVEFKP